MEIDYQTAEMRAIVEEMERFPRLPGQSNAEYFEYLAQKCKASEPVMKSRVVEKGWFKVEGDEWRGFVTRQWE